jgi:hypothetical protein
VAVLGGVVLRPLLMVAITVRSVDGREFVGPIKDRGTEVQRLSAKHIETQIGLLPLPHKRVEMIRRHPIEPRIAHSGEPEGKCAWELPA